MKRTIEKVTPKQALDWLSSAKNPRYSSGDTKVSRSHVKEFRRKIRDGSFVLSPQGIAFDEDGMLIDGFHRLTAIAEEGLTVDLMVDWDCPKSVASIIDRGLRRDASAVLGVQKDLAQIVNFIAGKYSGTWAVAAPTEVELKLCYQHFGDACRSVLNRCSTKRLKITTAAVRAVTAVSLKLGNSEALNLYEAIATIRFGLHMNAECTFRRLDNMGGSGGLMSAAEQCAVMWKALNLTQKTEVLRVMDISAACNEFSSAVREFVVNHQK